MQSDKKNYSDPQATRPNNEKPLSQQKVEDRLMLCVKITAGLSALAFSWSILSSPKPTQATATFNIVSDNCLADNVQLQIKKIEKAGFATTCQSQ
jgi:hypothetical protein